jgi:hypothetical protein
MTTMRLIPWHADLAEDYGDINDWQENATVDRTYWMTLDAWTPTEAAALLLEVDPAALPHAPVLLQQGAARLSRLLEPRQDGKGHVHRAEMVAVAKLFEDVAVPEDLPEPAPAAKLAPAKRTTSRGEANERLQWLVKSLFEVDWDKALTVAALRRFPAVRQFQEEQGMRDKRLTELLSAAAPEYARGSRGKSSPWEGDDEEVVLRF